MKVYNKKGFVSGIFMTALGLLDLIASITQNNFDIGYKAVENMVKCLQGEEYGDVDTGTEIVTADTAQDRLDRFAEWLS